MLAKGPHRKASPGRARRPAARPKTQKRHAPRAKATKRRPAKGKPGGGALSATLALFLAAGLAAVSVALAARTWMGRKSPAKSGRPVDQAPTKGRTAKTPAHAGLASAADRLAAAPGARPAAAAPDTFRLPEPPTIPAERRIYVFIDGKPLALRDDDARLAGHSIIDFSDNWVPYIFREETPGLDDFKKNEYRQTYINVANDVADEGGRKLTAGQHNYVELFGIPPSLSVLSKRFLDDEAKACYAKLRGGVLAGYRGAIRYQGGRGARAVLKRYRELKKQVKRAMRKTGAPSVNALKKRGHAWLAKRYRLYQTKIAVINQAQLRLRCEGLFEPGIKVGRYMFGHSTHKALSRFQRKHMIYGWGQLWGRTLRILGRSPRENNYAALRRVVSERVVHSLGIIEDGSAPLVVADLLSRKKKLAKNANLVGTYASKVLASMALTSADKALAFFRGQPPHIFKHFRVAVRLPKRPDYYSRRMRFEVSIDRGDVWYDSPYRADGKKRSFARARKPSLTLVAVQGKKRIPLVRYPTTIGGWRREWKSGKEYLAYKGSDVGPRIWRDIVAGPVWIPPRTTSPRSLVKTVRKGGKWIRQLNREGIGPSYGSAYGLVAAYHIEETVDGKRRGWKDNGIRSHGSVDYMSIMTRYSHGCHRLHNHLALRLFSFVVRHSKFVRRGQVPLAYARSFDFKKRKYTIRLHTRGYYYTLRHPVRVMVHEGRIRGKQREPFLHYLPVPGERYVANDPNLQPSGEPLQPGVGAGDEPSAALPPDGDSVVRGKPSPSARGGATADAATNAAAPKRTPAKLQPRPGTKVSGTLKPISDVDPGRLPPAPRP